MVVCNYFLSAAAQMKCKLGESDEDTRLVSCPTVVGMQTLRKTRFYDEKCVPLVWLTSTRLFLDGRGVCSWLQDLSVVYNQISVECVILLSVVYSNFSRMSQ